MNSEFFPPVPVSLAERLLRVFAGGVGVLGVPLLLGWATVPAVGVAFCGVMAIGAFWLIAAAPVSYQLAEGRTVVIGRRLLPVRVYRTTGGAERFIDIDALRRRKHPSSLATPGASAWTVGTHLTGGKGVPSSYRVFEHYSARRNLVRLEVDGGTLLVSPADPQGFLHAVRGMA
jgi:hypothetical protein